jgi:hypothetical protein
MVATAARGRAPEGGSMSFSKPPAGKASFTTAAQRRLQTWAKMTSKQKLADMEKEDRRRKRGRASIVDDECDGDVTIPLGMIIREEILQAGPVKK